MSGLNQSGDGNNKLANNLDLSQAIFGGEDYDIDVDGSGDLVIRDDNGNDVLIWDKSAAEWDFKSQDLANLNSVTTDEATIGGTKSDYHWTEDDNSPWSWSSGAGLDITLSESVEDGKVFRLVYDWNNGSKGSAQLELGFNGDTNTNYRYENNAGTESTGESNIDLLTNTSSFGPATGRVEFSEVSAETGVNHVMRGRFSRLNINAVYGSWEDFNVSTVNFIFPSGIADFNIAAYYRVIA
jgi:hypothetical protein